MGGRVGSITTEIIADGLVFNMDAANRASYVPNNGIIFNTLNSSSSGSFGSDERFVVTNGASCWSFDGVDDYIDINQDGYLTGMSNLTFGIWLYSDVYVYNAAVMGFGGIYDGPFSAQQWYGNFRLCISDTKGWNTSLDEVNCGGGSYGTGVWKNAVLTYDGSAGIVKTYENGIFQNSSSTSMSSLYSSTTEVLQLAKIPSRAYWNGKMTGLQIYTKTLSANEVLHNYNALKGRFGL